MDNSESLLRSNERTSIYSLSRLRIEDKRGSYYFRNPPFTNQPSLCLPTLIFLVLLGDFSLSTISAVLFFIMCIIFVFYYAICLLPFLISSQVLVNCFDYCSWIKIDMPHACTFSLLREEYMDTQLVLVNKNECFPSLIIFDFIETQTSCLGYMYSTCRLAKPTLPELQFTSV